MAGRFGAGPSLVLPACVGVAGLTLICIGQFGPNRHAIQDDLTSRSTAALASARLTGLSVSFSGRDATITGATTAEQADRAEALVSSVDGVRVVKADLAGDAAAAPSPAATATGPSPAVTDTPAQTQSPATETPAPDTSATETPATATPAATATAAPVAVPVGFTLVDGRITVTGTVRSTSAGHALIAAVKAAGNGWTVVDRLRVDGSITAPAPKAGRLPAL